jgi:hypothetical protein
VAGTRERLSDQRTAWRFRDPRCGKRPAMPAALVRMSIAERERYVRWWIEESGLSLVQLRAMAGAVWAGQGPAEARREVKPRGETEGARES